MVKLGKSYRGRASTNYRVAIEKVEKALRYAYRDRRARKGEFRALWIQRINAGAREYGLTYARFMNGLKRAGIELDRKQLSELAATEPAAFKALVDTAQSALKA
jgi:large subunit ribosomal protein L20